MNEINHFDLRVTYKRKERSKDSNGSDKVFTLAGKNLFYTERFWGFKSGNRKAQKMNIQLSDQEFSTIFSFIADKKLNVDYQEIIKIDKNYLRNDFTYLIELNIIGSSTIYQIQINDREADYKPWRDLEELFNFLQDFKKA